ncbi:hypothetical protein Poli38472_006902 [Pythium oligandrum]|uniref:Uncharacterized protein n=1 Tax=Pythium oligandrum TaxID=41045 RepID=A0A8K1FGJ1_PYTOL|nr:hypothetical protein Poli38472_006902 [Pythium oligandrum]|eukprot:TMW58757.1 hypothetical protein Poli38472_006902 [Pythium oligandrum]
MNAFTKNSEAPTSAFTDMRCRYTSKFCGNLRARKPNGEYHRFCDLHRHRANRNQRRWNHSRRCREKAQASDEASSPAQSPCKAEPKLSPTQRRVKQRFTPIQPQPESTDWLGELIDFMMPEILQQPIDQVCSWNHHQPIAPAPPVEMLSSIDVL